MKRTFGFTLLELMTTLAVLAILVALAAPSLAELIANNRMASASNSVLAGIQTARSEAITRGVPVLFCARNAGGTDCNGGLGNLTQGWLVGTDPNADGSVADGEVIRLSEPDNGSLSYTVGAVVTSNAIRYQASGRVTSGVSASGAMLDLCDSRTGEEGRRIMISTTGGASLNPSNPTCP